MKRKLFATLTTLMTIALIMTFVAIPGMAAVTYTPVGGTVSFKQYLTVESTAANDYTIPEYTFQYSVTNGTAVAASSSNVEILEGQWLAGSTIGTAAFSATDKPALPGLPTDEDHLSPTAGYKYVEKTVNIIFANGTFTKPGIYRFKVTQTNPPFETKGIKYDLTGQVRYLDVFVVYGDDPATTEVTETGLWIKKAVFGSKISNLADSGGYEDAGFAKTDGYTNQAFQHDVTFSKSIVGNQGDKNKRFKFDIYVTGNYLATTFPVQLTSVYESETGDTPINVTELTLANSDEVTLNEGTPEASTVPGKKYTFWLTDGSSIVIRGINDGATVKVVEDEKDYTCTTTEGSAAPLTRNYIDFNPLKADHSIIFTNTRDGIIPTGVIMSVAPYAIGVCLFGAVVIFLIGRKKRNLVEE